MDADLIDAWLASRGDGALLDEVRARFEGVPARYGHVIVDEAQDLSLLQLRAVQRRSAGLTLVGDDAQRSTPTASASAGPRRCSTCDPAEMATAYRMSAEIADWLNDHAAPTASTPSQLLGIRPTGVAVARGRRRPDDRRGAALADLAERVAERRPDRPPRTVEPQGRGVRRRGGRHRRHGRRPDLPGRVPRRPRAGDRPPGLSAVCPTAGRSVPEVVELQRDAEVRSFRRGDHRLQVVALLAGDPQLLALGLGLDALEPELLDELVELAGLVRRDAGRRWRACWRAVPPAASSTLP